MKYNSALLYNTATHTHTHTQKPQCFLVCRSVERKQLEFSPKMIQNSKSFILAKLVGI